MILGCMCVLILYLFFEIEALGAEDCEFKPQLVQCFHLRYLPKLFTKVQSHARCPQLETQDNSPDGGATASL